MHRKTNPIEVTCDAQQQIHGKKSQYSMDLEDDITYWGCPQLTNLSGVI